jgi:starch-binding outer membrane protein, SusD/RagB family
LYDRKNDSRFYKTYQTSWRCNNAASIPRWDTVGAFIPPPNIVDKPKFAFGDTSIWVTAEQWPAGTKLDSVYASRPYYYMPMNRQDNANFFVLRKHLDPTRPGFNDEIGFRDGVLFRLAETYLIAAEAYGRKGEFATAAARLNEIRKRAAYKEGEMKPKEYWRIEGGDYADRTKSTESLLAVTADQLSGQASFVEFMLDERGRELNGEQKRWFDLTRTEKLVDRVKKYNTGGANNVRAYHKFRPIPQNHIDRLDPKGTIEEEQNEGYY